MAVTVTVRLPEPTPGQNHRVEAITSYGATRRTLLVRQMEWTLGSERVYVQGPYQTKGGGWSMTWVTSARTDFADLTPDLRQVLLQALATEVAPFVPPAYDIQPEED